jgi:hypothetical protein
MTHELYDCLSDTPIFTGTEVEVPYLETMERIKAVIAYAIMGHTANVICTLDYG